jgi:hypothetical protein
VHLDLENAGTYSKQRTNERFSRYIKKGATILSLVFGWEIAKSDLALCSLVFGWEMAKSDLALLI